jgi:hypothetical protein
VVIRSCFERRICVHSGRCACMVVAVRSHVAIRSMDINDSCALV